MAYFRCSLGGGSGNGAVITVAYGAEFYNQTLVATNGVDTVSVVASSSGTADITVPSEGSWVISCTIGADTYTSDPVAVDLSYNTTLTALPDGKTVLPTDDIPTWLACAGITDKAYTTLSEVLADTDTYVTLLGDSNACDYMARSTTWADMTSQTGEVPTMTSNTTPSGVVSAGTDYDTNGAYKAFDGDDSTYWRGNTSTAQGATATDYIQYKFASPTIARSALIKNSVSGSTVNLTSVTVSASNDGSTFTSLYSDAISMPSTEKRVSFENDTAYSYYRVSLSVKNVSGSSMRLPHVSTLQFYEEAEIPSDADAMRLLGMYDYACYVLRQDNTWNTAINNSAYASYIPASPTGQTDIIVSAPLDTIYYLDNGNPVTLCTTDASGVGTVDWSTLPTGDITLYSSVAKDPDDLTADYSKSITVTKNKVEAWLMPNNTLYWYGYENANLEDMTSANGWSRTSWTLSAPTHNTGSIYLNPNTNSKANGIGSKNAIPASTAYAVVNGNNIQSNAYGYLGASSAKNNFYSSTLTEINVGSLTKYSVSVSASNYVSLFANNIQQATVYALWLE